MPSSFTIDPPSDYILKRDVCSYGYFVLAPNHWDPASRTLTRVLALPGGPATLTIDQPAPPRARERGRPLRICASRPLDRAEVREARTLLSRMLRLDESHEISREFHRLDPRWKAGGRARIFRSPTLFEDIVKTITSCNIQWPGTVVMNDRLCEVVGRGAFPTPSQLKRARPSTLRARCRVGYRDIRLIELADLFENNAIDEAALADSARDDVVVFKELLELPGVGPYSAANIMQLLGRYSRLPLDTESVRHGREVLGFKGTSAQVMKRVAAHFAPFGRHAFRSYWFELWTKYEARNGPAWTWPRRSGKAITSG